MKIVNQIKEKIRIERKNFKFKHSSPEQKRIIIAEEVLFRIKTKKMYAGTGNYVKPLQNNFSNEDKDVKFKSFVNNNRCDVCAIGGGFVAMVGITNGCIIPKSDYGIRGEIGQDYIWDFMSSFFPKSQLQLMEIAFEVHLDVIKSIEKEKWNDDFFILADKASHKYYNMNANDRMISIWQNVIDNNGNFVV